MNHDTFTKMVVALHRLNSDASEVAPLIIIPLMLAGIVFGMFLTRWIFRGGLSRSRFLQSN
jgi:hypothetical protein